MLYYRCRSAVKRSPRQCLVTTFLSSFEVLYIHVDITLTKESGHLYWVSMLHMRIAAMYHRFIKCRLKIIRSPFGAIFRKKKFHKWPRGA